MDMNGTQDTRLEIVLSWLKTLQGEFELQIDTLAPASSDAGFRRYFRIKADRGTMIVMDAPPELVPVGPYLAVGSLMKNAGVNVPEIYAVNESQGLILMSDLGTQTYLDMLNEENAASMMDAATDSLVLWQKATQAGMLPDYDRAVLKREIDLFGEWYVAKHRGYQITEAQNTIIQNTFEKIIANNLAESRVYVHRDFMPRNLMVCEPMPGVIDFQDALLGPVSYDIASLMRDAFISWGEPFVLDVTIRYWDKARRAGIDVPEDFGAFWKNVEWMGMQRHLKVLGIFARLNYRDNKPKYLADTPRFLHYVRETANRYDELKAINWLLDQFEETKSKGAYTF